VDRRPGAGVMICPSCHFENIQGMDECENCGADLRTSDIPQPGNVLEARLVHDHLSELGAERPLSVSPGDSVRDVVRQMQERGIGSVLVRDGEAVAGIFTERDALKKLTASSLDGRLIGDVMTPDPVMLREDDSVAVAISCALSAPFFSTGEIYYTSPSNLPVANH